MLHRAAVLACLLAPLAAQAQTASVTISPPGPFGTSKCVAAGNANDPTLTLTWTVVPPSSPTPTTEWVYKVKALPSGANCTSDTDAANVINQSTINWKAGNEGSYPGTSGDSALKLSKIISLSKYSCSVATDQTITICVQLLNGSTVATSVSGTLVLQLAPPNAPTGVTVSPGMQALNVSWSAPADTTVAVDHYSVTARTLLASCPDPTKPTVACLGAVAASGTTSSQSLRLSGLANGITYGVQVSSFSVGGNESPLSDPPVAGTPELVRDFWDEYKNAGGVEEGGCGGGSAGVLSLLAMAGLVRTFRRRS